MEKITFKQEERILDILGFSNHIGAELFWEYEEGYADEQHIIGVGVYLPIFGDLSNNLCFYRDKTTCVMFRQGLTVCDEESLEIHPFVDRAIEELSNAMKEFENWKKYAIDALGLKVANATIELYPSSNGEGTEITEVVAYITYNDTRNTIRFSFTEDDTKYNIYLTNEDVDYDFKMAANPNICGVLRLVNNI